MIHPYGAKYRIVSRDARSFDDGFAIVCQEASIKIHSDKLSQREYRIIEWAIRQGALTVELHCLKPLETA